jgi:hypothetical protein
MTAPYMTADNGVTVPNGTRAHRLCAHGISQMQPFQRALVRTPSIPARLVLLSTHSGQATERDTSPQATLEILSGTISGSQQCIPLWMTCTMRQASQGSEQNIQVLIHVEDAGDGLSPGWRPRDLNVNVFP